MTLNGIHGVTLPLLDASGRTIGAVDLQVKPHLRRRDGKAEALKLARRYRDELARRIPSEDKMFEPTR